MKIESSKNKNVTDNKTQSLAEITAQIEALNQQRIALVEPQKLRYAELRKELVAMEAEIRQLDSNWRPEQLKAKAVVKITEILTAKGQPMTVEEIIKEVKGMFTNWKIKKTLSDKSEGEKSVFTMSADGKYSIKV